MPIFPAVTDVLLFVGLILAFVIIRLLIPRREDILVGKVRFKMESSLVPVLLSIVTVIGIVVLSLSLLQETMPIGSIVGAVLLLAGSVLIWIEFVKVKKLNAQVVPMSSVAPGWVPQDPSGYQVPAREVQHVEEVSVQGSSLALSPSVRSLPQQPARTIKVECPQCGSHIEILPGSDQITCPHCGLSGTM